MSEVTSNASANDACDEESSDEEGVCISLKPSETLPNSHSIIYTFKRPVWLYRQFTHMLKIHSHCIAGVHNNS